MISKLGLLLEVKLEVRHELLCFFCQSKNLVNFALVSTRLAVFYVSYLKHQVWLISLAFVDMEDWLARVEAFIVLHFSFPKLVLSSSKFLRFAF